MTVNDLYTLSPEISLAVLAGIIILLDLFIGRKEYLAYVAIIGLIVPLVFTGLLWGEVIDWWSISGKPSGEAMAVMFDTLLVDQFSLFFKGFFILSLGLVLLASIKQVGFYDRQGEYYALLLISAIGMMLLAAATDLIVLYVSLELSTLPLVALVAFQGDVRSSEAGLKFLLLAAFSSGLLLYGLTLLYGFVGSTNLSTIGMHTSSLSGQEPFYASVLLLAVVFMLAGFGFKIAAIPFQMWIPDVYEGAPTTVTSYLSVASKAAGFAVILRVFYMGLGSFEVDWGILFAGLSAASMTIGNFVAFSQKNIKRLLGYSTIAHAGYMMIGLAAVTSSASINETVTGPTTVLFYLVGYGVTNFLAFFGVLAVTTKTGSELIDDFSGISTRSPLLALILGLALLSLTGIPPTVGFMAKLFIFTSAMNAGLTWLVLLGLLNSVASAYYYLRIIRNMYSGKTESATMIPISSTLRIALGILAVGVIALGVWPSGLFHIADLASSSILR